jgi:uncharacterized protein
MARSGAPSTETPWRVTADRLVLRVRLTPKSSKDAIEGIEDTADGPAIKARVRAVPEDGAANAALEQLIAKWLDLPKRSVTLIGGGKSRVKTLALSGAADRLVGALKQRLLADAQPTP